MEGGNLWMNRCCAPCIFQLVLRYNREPGESVGRVIEDEVIAGILCDLRRRFGEHTILGKPDVDADSGSWKGMSEPSIGIKVAVLPERVKELEEFVYDIGIKLKQEAMYFEAGPPSVKILRMHDYVRKSLEGGKSHVS